MGFRRVDSRAALSPKFRQLKVSFCGFAVTLLRTIRDVRATERSSALHEGGRTKVPSHSIAPATPRPSSRRRLASMACTPTVRSTRPYDLGEDTGLRTVQRLAPNSRVPWSGSRLPPGSGGDTDRTSYLAVPSRRTADPRWNDSGSQTISAARCACASIAYGLRGSLGYRSPNIAHRTGACLLPWSTRRCGERPR